MISNFLYSICVCRFLNGSDEAFSTEPLKNENEDLALGFYHMQNVRSHMTLLVLHTNLKQSVSLML